MIGKSAISMIGGNQMNKRKAAIPVLVCTLMLVVLVGGMLVVNYSPQQELAPNIPTVTRAPEPGYYCGDAVCSVGGGESTFTCPMDCELATTETPLPSETPIPVPASEPPSS